MNWKVFPVCNEGVILFDAIRFEPNSPRNNQQKILGQFFFEALQMSLFD